MEPGEFRGVAGRYYWESEPWWPPAVTAPDGAPNVLLIVLDDVGFAQLGCFGSDIDTPVIDALADGGLKYTNFHTTALCSPTRACLLSGRNHHANGMGRITELAMGFPGYDGRIPRANGLLPEMLVPHGYAAWAVGKWHLTPEDECHHGASRVRWPLGRGFERFYGFFEGETHQFAPALVIDNHRVDPPSRPDYHLTSDLVDQAIGMVRDLRTVDPGKPFFLYFCTGACHAPHQAPKPWIDSYRGRFDAGWDVWRDQTFARQRAAGLLPKGTRLSPRPDWVPAWAALSNDEQRLYARYMEAFAGFLSHTDYELGRLVDCLRDTGDLDNTLLFILSDNGASSEGGPTGSVNDVRLWNWAPKSLEEALRRIDEIGGPRLHNNYPWGWTVAGNTPFRRWKREVHEGGVADPLIVHWPAGLAARGETRHQYVHAIDVLPTVLEAAGITAAQSLHGVTQRPIDGSSFGYTFSDANAADRHETQYYEMFGCRALYHRGWKAVTYHPVQVEDPRLDTSTWELYHVADDASECEDLAAQDPERLRALVDMWWREAEKHQVLPLDNRPFSELVFGRPDYLPPRQRYTYYPGTAIVPEQVAVNVRNRSHTITADVDIPPQGATGVLVAQGSLLGGWSLFLNDGHLRYVHNYVGLEEHRVDASVDLSAGPHRLAFHFEKTADLSGVGTLWVDGAQVGRGEIPRFTPIRFSLIGAGLSCGRDAGLTVTDDYPPGFPFTGRIHRVVIEVDGVPYVDPAAEAQLAIAEQ